MIYLDNHATTTCDPRVVEAMMPFFTTTYGNPSSGHHFGLIAAASIENATGQVAALLYCRPGEITFTSGATESNNLVLLGITRGRLIRAGDRNKIVTTRIEHKAILGPISTLSAEGWEIAYLPINSDGLIDLTQAAKIIDDRTFLVTVQLANSEIGTIQPLKELSEISSKHGALIHCDAAQAVGKIPIDVDEYGIDFLSFSGHKIYGPKGIGGLWIKDGLKKFIHPLMFGGGNIDSIRPGTAPVPLIVGLGIACMLSQENFSEENERVRFLRDHFEYILKTSIPGLIINGALQNRLPNNSNLTFPNVDGEMLIAAVPDIIMSTGSACESGSIEPSRVLTAIGISRDSAYSTIRIGLGRFSALDEIEEAADLICKAYWELAKIMIN